MPGSDNRVRHALLSHMRRVGIPGEVLDIGPGAGFYGKALRSLKKDIKIWSIEIWEDYIRKFKLDSIYDRVFCADVRAFDYSACPADLVILADIVEHLPKADAVSVIEKLKEYYGWLLITMPIVPYEQGTYDDNPHEAHLHQWSSDEIIEDLGMSFLQDCGTCGLFEWSEEPKANHTEYTPASFNFKVHFTCRSEDGSFYESSAGKEPLEFAIGQLQFVEGLQLAVVGMRPGESKTIYIASDEALGPYNKQLVEVVGRNELSDTLSLEVGKQLVMLQTDGTALLVTIIDVDETTVTVDANHPLAGKNLILDIQVVENG